MTGVYFVQCFKEHDILEVWDSSHVEGVSVNLQVDMIHCGTVQAASLSASPNFGHIHKQSEAISSKLMIILVNQGQIFN